MNTQQRKFYLIGVILMLVPSNGSSVERNEAKKGWDVFVKVRNTEKYMLVTDAAIVTLSAKALSDRVIAGLKDVE